jgi:hypothetical protein
MKDALNDASAASLAIFALVVLLNDQPLPADPPPKAAAGG